MNTGTISTNFDEFVAFVLEEAAIDAAGVALAPSTSLVDDLECDSLQLFQVVDAIEGAVPDLSPSSDDWPEIRTLQDAFDYYRRLLSALPR